MPFTDHEREQWHREKRAREYRPPVQWAEPAAAVCIHCHQSFGLSSGVITAEVAICDVCNGD